MALTNSVRGTVRKMMMRPTGTIIAPPTPWMKRAATSAGNDDETAHKSDPTRKTAMAALNTEREP